MGTRSYTWKHGRQLESISDVGYTWMFTYDANGMRKSRSNGSATYTYTYNGSKLMQMTRGTDVLDFYYDASGTPVAFKHNGTTYYYVTTIQGDILLILDADGEIVVSYDYDAWGKLLAIGGSMATTLGTLNPLTYRGYVYDHEYGLYYLQSRYYNPELGRFINADAFVSTGQGLLGNNMFVYCNNNPVNCADPSGTITMVCYGNDVDMLSMPWQDAGPAGGWKFDFEKTRQKVDITERLNIAMIDHAIELCEVYEMYGGMAAAIHFYKMVRSGGEWDFKSQDDWNLEKGTVYLYNGKELAYDDIGNIHYGFVGRVLFTEEILLMGAGYAQIRAGTSSVFYFQTFFDDPRDQKAIKFGFYLWESGFHG